MLAPMSRVETAHATFYSTLAQITPVLFAVLAFEMRSLKNRNIVFVGFSAVVLVGLVWSETVALAVTYSPQGGGQESLAALRIALVPVISATFLIVYGAISAPVETALKKFDRWKDRETPRWVVAVVVFFSGVFPVVMALAALFQGNWFG